jgi:hypothetical protein
MLGSAAQIGFLEDAIAYSLEDTVALPARWAG